MSRLSVLRSFFTQHKYQLLLTYSLFALEMLGTLLRPFFLGEAVNDLIKGSYNGLVILSVQHLIWMVIGTARHMYDTRTYSSIYTSLVTKLLTKRKAKNDTSKLSAHATLAREFVDFLEFDLTYIVEMFYNLVGSLILLYFYDAQVVLVCVAILVPVLLLSYWYAKHITRLNKLKNDELENQVNIINSRNVGHIQKHFAKLRKWQIKISDREAWNFGFMELLVLVVITVSLIISTKSTGEMIMAGNVIGIYTYILKFVTGLDTIPYTVQKMSSLKDIAHRIEFEEEDLVYKEVQSKYAAA